MGEPEVTFSELRSLVMDPDRPRRMFLSTGMPLPGANVIKTPEEVTIFHSLFGLIHQKLHMFRRALVPASG